MRSKTAKSKRLLALKEAARAAGWNVSPSVAKQEKVTGQRLTNIVGATLFVHESCFWLGYECKSFPGLPVKPIFMVPTLFGQVKPVLKGRGDPEGLHELGSSSMSTSTGPSSDVSSSVFSSQDEKVKRLVQQLQALKGAMDPQKSPKSNTVPDSPDSGTKSSAVEPMGGTPSSSDSPTPTLSARCLGVVGILKAAKARRLSHLQDKIEGVPQISGNHGGNEHVLPDFVSCSTTGINCICIVYGTV